MGGEAFLVCYEIFTKRKVIRMVSLTCGNVRLFFQMGGTSFSIDDQLGNRVAASGQIFKDDTNDFLHLFKVS